MVLGHPEVALDVAYSRFAPRAELHALRRVPPGLRRDVDDAVAGSRPIERRTRSALHHLDGLDVAGVQVRERAIDDHAVHDDERVLAPAGRVERRRPAQQDGRLRTRAAAVSHDVRRNLPLQLPQRVCRGYR